MFSRRNCPTKPSTESLHYPAPVGPKWAGFLDDIDEMEPGMDSHEASRKAIGIVLIEDSEDECNVYYYYNIELDLKREFIG